MNSVSTPTNLDRLAAQSAQELIRKTQEKKKQDVDNAITKALGVLQENGVFACFLYLLAKEDAIGRIVVSEMLTLLEKLGHGWGKPDTDSAENILKFITDKITVNLETAILAKEMLEQMLIYARYSVKARSG